MKKLIIFAVSLFVCFSSAYAVEAAKKDRFPDFLKEFVFERFGGFCEYPDIQFPDAELPEAAPLPDEDAPQEEKPESDNGAGQEKPEQNENPEASSLQMEIHNLINREREKHGLAPLELSSALSSVAKAHSIDMAEKNYFSHTSQNGLSPFDRLKNAGISYGIAAENIAAGQRTAEDVVKSWMNSEGHRKNILNGSYKKTGIGTASGGTYNIYYTQIFTD